MRKTQLEDRFKNQSIPKEELERMHLQLIREQEMAMHMEALANRAATPGGVIATSASPVPIQFYDGSTLTGWTNADNTYPPQIDVITGNPAPSFKTISPGRGFLRDLGVTFHNKTITFDFMPGTSFDGGLLFASNAVGNGSYKSGLQLKQSATAIAGQGLRAGSNGGWLYFGVGAPETLAAFTSTSTWYAIKIQITADRACSWYINDVLQASTYTIPVGYTIANTTDNYWGFISNNTIANFDNVAIYEGMV